MANIKLTFSTAVDLQGLQQLEKKLQDIRTMAKTPGDNLFADLSPTEINKTIQAVNTLERAIKSAYNVDLNTISVNKFNQQLKKSNMTIQDLRTNLAKAGPAGQQSFLILANQLTNFTKQVKYTNKFLSDMQQAFKNTITWGVSSGIWNTMLSETQKAYRYVIDLDKSLNDIRVVTGKSANEMTRFAKEANKAAKELAVSTKAYTEGALIYYQQGLDTETVKTLTEITAKASNVTGQSMSTVSEQLTAVWNGYQVANQAAEEGMQVYEEYVDKMAAVGATTAADLEELATAMSKVASAASSMGVGFDELSAQIATIVSVTRQAPESVGTALKTIYARLGDLQVDGVDEFGVSLGTVSGQLKTMGIDVMDTNGNMRDMDEVMTEVAEKWDTWTNSQKEAAAVAMAGKRQYNNLIALFDNWDMYGDSLKTSMEAAGTLNEQQEIALESLDKKLEKMTVAAEKFYDALFDEKSIGAVVDGLTTVIDLVANLTSGVGGLLPILGMLGASLIKSFGADIGKGFVGFKASVASKEQQEEKAKKQVAADLKMSQKSIDEAENPRVKKEIDNLIKMQEKRNLLSRKMTEEDKKQYDLIKKERVESVQRLINLEQEVKNYQTKGDLGKKLSESIGQEKIDQREINALLEQRQILLKGMVDEIFSSEDGQDEHLQGNYRSKEESTEAYAEREKIKKQAEKVIEEAGGKKGLEEKKEKVKNLEKNGISDEDEELKNLRDEIEKVEKAFDDLDKAIKESEALVNDFVDGYTEALQVASNSGEENNDFFERYKKLLKENIIKTGNFEEAVHNTALELSKENGELLEASYNLEKYGQEVEAAGQQQEEFEDALDTEVAFSSLADAIGSCIQVVTGFGMALNSLQAASDPTKSFLENLVAGFGGLATSLISIFIGISQFKTAMDTLLPVLQPILTSVVAAFKGMATGVTGAITSIPVVGWILGIIAAVGTLIAIITVAYNAYRQEKLNKVAEEADKVAEASKRITQETQKEKEAIDAVIDSYKDLQEQYENHELSLGELRARVYDLCNEYELEDLALKALIEDYETLASVMKDQQIAANEKFIADAAAEESALKKSVQANLYKNIDDSAQESVNGEQYIDIVDGAGDTGTVKDILSDYIDDENAFSGGFVSNEALTEAIINNYDEIYERLSVLTDESAKHLLSAMDSVAEKINRAEELGGQISETKKENAVLKYDTENIKSVSDYRQAVASVSEQVAESDSEEDKAKAEKWAEGALGAKVQDKQIVIDYKLAYQIEEKTGKSIEDIDEELKNLTSSEKNFIALHLDTALAEESFEVFLSKYGNFKDASEGLQIKGFIDPILSNENKTSLTKDEIDSLYNFSDFEAMVGMTKEAFSAMDYESQKLAMSQYYTESEQLMIENKDLAIQQAKDIIASIEEEKAKFAGDGYKNNPENDVKTILEKTGMTREELATTTDFSKLEAAARAHMGDEKFEELSSEDRTNYYTALQEKAASLTDEQIEAAQTQTEYNDALEEFEKRSKAAQDKLASLENYTVDYTTRLQNARNVISKNSKELDNLQSEYQSLTSVVNDYNEAGKFSLDNFQALLSLSPEMLAALDYENGKLSINEQAIKKLALARIDGIKAAIYEETQTGLLTIMQGQAKTATEGQTEATNNLAVAAEEAAEAAQNGIAPWIGYWTAATNGEFEGDISKNQEALDFLEGQMVKMQGVNQLAEDILNNSLNSTLGSKTEKDLKNYFDEFDRYWDINKAIQAVTDSLEDLNKAQEHMSGEDLIKSLEKENELLQDKEERYKSLLSLKQQEAADLRGSLGKYGLSFNEEGGIANYAEITKAMLEGYNAGTISQEYYEQFKKELERYEELYYNEIEEIKNELDDIDYEELANNLEKWEAEIQLQLDMSEAERDWEDFYSKINNTSFKMQYEDIDLDLESINKQLDTYTRAGGTLDVDRQAVMDAKTELAKIQQGGKSDKYATESEAKAAVEAAEERLKEDTLTAKELWEAAWSGYMDGIDQAADKMEEVNDKYNRINSNLEYQNELIGLLYGSDAYDMMDKVLDAQIQNSSASVSTLAEQTKMWKEMYESAEEGSEEQAKYYDLWQKSESELQAGIVNHIKLLKEDYNNTLDGIIDNLEKELTGGMGLDEMREEWEEAKEAADKYYDSADRIYQLETLEGKFNKAISNASSLKTQQQLKKLMDQEISALEEKEKLTEYDIKLAEKRLSIAEAEAALENAQNSKQSMKLTRGATGNWEYQYVVDDDDIAEKKQNVLDAYNDMRTHVKEAQQESLDAIVSSTEKFFDELNKIRNDDTLNEEEKAAAMEALREKYYGEDGIITNLQKDHASKTDDLNKANAEYLWGLYQSDTANYERMTDDEKDLIDGLKEEGISDYTALRSHVDTSYDEMKSKLETVTEQMSPIWNTAAANMAKQWNSDDGNSVKEKVSAAFGEIETATSNYSSELELLKTNTDNYFNGEAGINSAINGAKTATDNLKTSTQNLCKDTKTDLENYQTTIAGIEAKWLAAKKAAEDALKVKPEDIKVPTQPSGDSSTPPSSTSPSGGNANKPSSNQNNKPNENNSNENNTLERLYNNGVKAYTSESTTLYNNPDTGSTSRGALAAGSPYVIKTRLKERLEIIYKNGDGYSTAYIRIPGAPKTPSDTPGRAGNKIPVAKFDTGGYTGDWGDTKGKVAILHSKEMVLNAKDTKNILDAVKILRVGNIKSTEDNRLDQQMKDIINDIEVFLNKPDALKEDFAESEADRKLKKQMSDLNAENIENIMSAMQLNDEISETIYKGLEGNLEATKASATVSRNMKDSLESVESIDSVFTEFFKNLEEERKSMEAWSEKLSASRKAEEEYEEYSIEKGSVGRDIEQVFSAMSKIKDFSNLTSSIGSIVNSKAQKLIADMVDIKASSKESRLEPVHSVADSNVFNIVADFPNANDVESIKEAILSLPNLASQYISKNKK